MFWTVPNPSSPNESPAVIREPRMDLHADQRTDRLLTELSARYDLKASFLAKLRPLAHCVLHEPFDAERRVRMMEKLAEACERDQILRDESERAQAAAQDFVARLKTLLRTLEDKRREMRDRS